MGQFLRFVLILIGLWLVLTIVKRALSSRRKSSPGKPPAVAKMVACAHCGVHIPESEALREGNRHYCSAEHYRQARN